MKIQVVQDLICPWCYIEHHNLQAAIAEWSAKTGEAVELEWLPYQLDPLDPLEPGAPPEDFRERFITRKGMNAEQMQSMFDRVTQAGASLGISFDFEKVTVAVDTLPGHVAIAAAPAGKQEALVQSFHKAYFEEGRDIGQLAEILSIAERAGLAPDEVASIQQALAEPGSLDVVRHLIGQVHAAGITGVPYFIVDNTVGLSGGQPVEVFKQAFAQAGAAVTA